MFAAEEARRARTYLDETSEGALAAPVGVDLGDTTLRIAPWQGLEQPLTHSSQHRSEAAMLLTRFGRSPGDIDFIFSVYPELRPSLGP